MENALCPECGRKLLVDKCLSETDAVMKCKHCKKTFNVSYDEKTFPSNLNSFNWGAFLMNDIWCFFNGKIGMGILLFLLYVLSNLIPFIGFIFSIPYIIITIYLGVKGNKIAWNHKEWKSVEAFEKAQKGWLISGKIMLVVAIIMGILIVIF